MDVLRIIWGLIVETFENFDADEVPRRAAAISYFLLLALAPVLLIVNAVLGLVGARVDTAAAPAGAAEATSTATAAYAQVTTWAGSYAPYVLAVVVIAAAMSVFGQFVGALEVIWKTPHTRTPVRGFLRSNALSLVLLGVAAVALLAAILLSSVVVMFGSIALSYIKALGVELSGIGLALLARGVVVFVAAALLFEVAFTVVPDRKINWRDVLPGALITAGLFLVGETALSTYLSTTERFSVFGTFQFFVVLIVWIYYSSLVALWGAELTRLLVLRFEARREDASADDAST
jgi:membrane protein